HVRRPDGLVLPHEEGGDPRGQPPQDLTISIDQMPAPRDRVLLRHDRRHTTSVSTHSREKMSERPLRGGPLGHKPQAVTLSEASRSVTPRAPLARGPGGRPARSRGSGGPLPAAPPSRGCRGTGRPPAASLPGPGAEGPDRTGRAGRSARVAYLAAVR